MVKDLLYFFINNDNFVTQLALDNIFIFLICNQFFCSLSFVSLMSLIYFIIGLNFLISRNIVHMALYLILNVLLLSIFFFYFKLEFFAFIFIIVYVGAVAVLFLFITMLIHRSLNLISKNMSTYFLFFYIFGLFSIAYLLYILITTNFEILENSLFYYYNFEKLLWYNLEVKNNPIKAIGYFLYNIFWFLVIIVGIILLVVMLAILFFFKI